MVLFSYLLVLIPALILFVLLCRLLIAVTCYFNRK